MGVLFYVFACYFLELPLSSNYVVSVAYDSFVLDLLPHDLQDSAEPSLEDVDLIVIAERDILHEDDMLEDQSAVMQYIDILFEGDLSRQEGILSLGGIKSINGHEV